LIVDHDAEACRSISQHLGALGWDVESAHSLASAAERLEAGSSDPALVTLELNLPDGDGAALVPIVQRCAAGASIVVISGCLTASRCLQLNGLGVSVCLPKPVIAEDLRCLADHVAARRRSRRPGWALSKREWQVLACARAGLSRKETASRLGISLATVATHWKRMLSKTGLDSERRVLIAAGLGEPARRTPRE
jgi:DNA-binding NarL/FixJ family response regulator